MPANHFPSRPALRPWGLGLACVLTVLLAVPTTLGQGDAGDDAPCDTDDGVLMVSRDSRWEPGSVHFAALGGPAGSPDLRLVEDGEAHPLLDGPMDAVDEFVLTDVDSELPLELFLVDQNGRPTEPDQGRPSVRYMPLTSGNDGDFLHLYLFPDCLRPLPNEGLPDDFEELTGQSGDSGEWRIPLPDGAAGGDEPADESGSVDEPIMLEIGTSGGEPIADIRLSPDALKDLAMLDAVKANPWLYCSVTLTATLAPPDTTYEVKPCPVVDPNGLDYDWTHTEKCGSWVLPAAKHQILTWGHGDDSDCPHDSPSHPGTVSVDVFPPDTSRKITLTYTKGSDSGSVTYQAPREKDLGDLLDSGLVAFKVDPSPGSTSTKKTPLDFTGDTPLDFIWLIAAATIVAMFARRRLAK